MDNEASCKEQVKIGLELVAVALDLSDKLLNQPSGLCWFTISVDLFAEWEDEHYGMDFESMVEGEKDLLLFLKDSIIEYSRWYLDGQN